MGAPRTLNPWIVLPTQSFFAGGARRMGKLMSWHVSLSKAWRVSLSKAWQVSSGNNPIAVCSFATPRDD